MSDPTNQSTGSPVEPSAFTGREPESREVNGQGAGTGSGLWRWAIGAVVALLLVYPLTRWMTAGGGQATDGVPLPAASQLQTSFEHYQAGRFPEAIAAAKAALAVDPNLAEAYNNLAVSYMGLHQLDEALHAAQEAVRLKPDYQLAKNNLAWIQREMTKGTAPAAPAVPVNPASVALLNQSLAHFQAGRFKECIETAKESAKLNPNSPQAFNNIGICSADLQLWDEAIRNTQEAIRLDPDYQLAKNNLAWMQKQMGQPRGQAK